MDESKTLPFKSFNPTVMLNNIDYIRGMIQRIRQKEGGIGSIEDELSLYRTLQDLDLLVDITDGLKAAYDDQTGKLDTVASVAVNLQKQNDGLRTTYEKMVQERNDRIKDLETELGIRPEKAETDPKTTPDTDTE